MTPAVFDQTTVDVAARAAERTYDFRVNGERAEVRRIFKGVGGRVGGHDSAELTAAQTLEKISVASEQKFTQPPPRFTKRVW